MKLIPKYQSGGKKTPSEYTYEDMVKAVGGEDALRYIPGRTLQYADFGQQNYMLPSTTVLGPNFFRSKLSDYGINGIPHADYLQQLADYYTDQDNYSIVDPRRRNTDLISQMLKDRQDANGNPYFDPQTGALTTAGHNYMARHQPWSGGSRFADNRARTGQMAGLLTLAGMTGVLGGMGGALANLGRTAVTAGNGIVPKIAAGYLLGEAGNKGLKLLTGKDFGQNATEYFISPLSRELADITGNQNFVIEPTQTVADVANMFNPLYGGAEAVAKRVVDPAITGARKVIRYAGSPITRNWTQFGNREYRWGFQPGYLGEGAGTFKGIKGESRIPIPENYGRAGWVYENNGSKVIINPKYPGKRMMLNEQGKLVGESQVQQSQEDIATSLMINDIISGKISEEELSQLVSRTEAQWLLKNKDAILKNRKGAVGNYSGDKFMAIVRKAAANGKGKKGYNEAIKAGEELIKAHTPKGRVKLLRDKYIPRIQESARETGIDWDEMSAGSMMSGMPVNFKVGTVGFDKKTPFLERYYKNVHEIIKPGGFQDQLLKSGDLRRLPNGKWEGRFPDGNFYQVFRPEEYVKVRWARDVKGYKNIELPFLKGIHHNYPMHGTAGITGKGGKDIHYLTEPSEYVGKNGLWAAIMDGSEGAASAIAHYKGQGYSIPFFRTPELETPTLSWWKDSYGLSPLLNESPMYMDRVIRPIGVKDANMPWGFINEYNWGPNAPMPKSSWNTLDFEPGAGPFAYNPEQDKNTDYLTYNYLT